MEFNPKFLQLPVSRNGKILLKIPNLDRCPDQHQNLFLLVGKFIVQKIIRLWRQLFQLTGTFILKNSKNTV